MSYVGETLSNLLHQTAFFNLTWGNYVMILVAFIFLYLAIKKGFEPLLLVPIAFGMLLVNIYPDIMASPEETSNGVGGLLHYFYLLDEWSILPSLIFMGVGAMTDFGPLIANPISFLLGAAAQLGIYAAYFLAIFLGFNGKAAAAISIIGGADGPTSIFLAGKLGQSALMGPIAVAAYSYMSLVPIIQPPIMKLCTTEKERKIKMDQLRPVSKLEKILFPIIITIVVCMILPTTAPLVGMLMLGNLFRESGVVKQLKWKKSLSFQSLSDLKNACLLGAGIAGDIPLIHCIDELEEGKLVNVLRGWKRPAAGCYLYSTKHFVEYRRVKTFLDWMAEKHREILEQIDNRFGQLA